ncbi:MAG TPA: cytochrome C oxidase subunit II, partial [Elusimicrobiota bacterium]|nr:cytochrome C oxidase subunit II [Elusimicrobiota bacterium]
MASSIPKTEQRVIILACMAIAVQLGLIGFAALRLGITVPTCVTNLKPFTAGAFITQAPDRYEVHMLARMWAFEPNVIRVPQGSVVDFYLTSKDVTH